MKFEEYLKSGKVRRSRVQESLATSLIIAAREDYMHIRDTKITRESASFLFKNIYDCIHKMFESRLVVNGYKSYDHSATIQFVYENNLIDKRTAESMDKFRKLRNDIQYRGVNATADEAKNIKETYLMINRKFTSR